MLDRGNWIQTYTGKQFYALDPQPDDICIEDIAHALSNMCRYAGHCKKFYSVAEHSILVAESVAPEYQLAALLHDASEAYLVDIPRPFKAYLDNYYELEGNIMDVIYTKFGADQRFHDVIKSVDTRILNDEREQNMNTSEHVWDDYGDPLGVKLKFLSPEEAEGEFLAFFDAIIEREGILVSA